MIENSLKREERGLEGTRKQYIVEDLDKKIFEIVRSTLKVIHGIFPFRKDSSVYRGKWWST